MTRANKPSYSLDNIVKAGEYNYSNAKFLFLPKFLQSLFSSKKLVWKEFEATGILVKPLEELFEFLTKNGGRQVVDKPHCGDFSFVWPDNSFAGIIYNEKSNHVNINGNTFSPKLERLTETLKEKFISESKKNLVFAVVKTPDGFDTTLLGDGASPLIEENYLPEVLEDVNHVVESFQKTPPGGRIVILNGEPGTGKTHLIRSILPRIDCVFLIVSSGLIADLDKPELMPMLISVKETYEKPIIMIIEDGDTCLVPRKSDNISSIASLLNLSDGILGTILDIKLIISTNAEIKNMDQAILRPGRLCRDIHVGALPYEQANKVYKRLTNNKDVDIYNVMPQHHFTLAEIYDVVNNPKTNGPTTSKVKRNVIGFSNPPYDSLVNKAG